MSEHIIYNTAFTSLRESDRVGDATRRMLEHRVSDLPVVDPEGRLVGLFKLDRLFASLLPKAALLGYGMPDLAFVADTLATLRERMRAIEDEPVGRFIVKPDHVAHPDTSPVEIVLLLYKGANNIPVVARASGQLLGMAAARDVLAALHGGEG
jgi:CBS-domain-containing membrane protein